jgi:nucleoside 2-deoxyribosyltransferase
MKFYIATKLENHVNHNIVRDFLISDGHTITYDWSIHGSVKSEGKIRLAEVEKLERNGVQNADGVIVLLPGGRGTHVELGLALAFNINVFLYAPAEYGFLEDDDRTCAFYHNPLITSFTGSWDQMLIDLKTWAYYYG